MKVSHKTQREIAEMRRDARWLFAVAGVQIFGGAVAGAFMMREWGRGEFVPGCAGAAASAALWMCGMANVAKANRMSRYAQVLKNRQKVR